MQNVEMVRHLLPPTASAVAHPELGPNPVAACVPPLQQADVVHYPNGQSFPVAYADACEALPGRTCAALIEAPADAPLSKHFRVGDFAADEAEVARLRVHPVLVQKLEELRAALRGCYLVILSGYRCKDSSLHAGRGPELAHARGLAADVTCPLASLESLFRAAQSVLQGCGSAECRRHSGYIHFEVDPSGGSP